MYFDIYIKIDFSHLSFNYFSKKNIKNSVISSKHCLILTVISISSIISNIDFKISTASNC